MSTLYLDLSKKPGDPDAVKTSEDIISILKNRIAGLQKENAELNETIDANLRVHKAAKKADEERIFKLLSENNELRECLKEASDLECTSRGCLSFRDKTCHGTYDCGIVKKWRAVLSGE